VTGQKLATYAVTGDPSVVYFWDNYDNAPTPTVTVALATSNYYFGGKLIKNANGYIGSDRLGSMGKYYPWGQEKPSATTNGTEKFTGYFRDAETGLDYALNRYHQPGMGRFLTPDPYRASGGPKDPASWNRYAYAGSDPVNHRDPTGQDWCWADDFDPDGLNPCGVPLICAPNFVPTEYGCSLNIQIPPIDLSGLANIDPYVLDADILTAEGVFDSSTVATNGDPQNDSFQVSLSPDALLVLYQNGLLQASPQTIDLAEKGFEEVLTLGTAAIAAITVWIQSNKAKFFAQEAETERDRLFRCAQQFLEDLKRCTSIPNPETRKQCIAFAIARKRNCLGQVNPPSSK
jgi:RHS repeat-associated protein